MWLPVHLCKFILRFVCEFVLRAAVQKNDLVLQLTSFYRVHPVARVTVAGIREPAKDCVRAN
jgi:hypothetical protein